MKWWRWFALVVLTSMFWVWRQAPSEKLRLVFCDVGQGDAALVIKGSFQMLIDTGENKEKLFGCLNSNIPFWDREIEVAVNSHGDRDHWGVIGAVRDAYQIDRELTATNSAIGDIVRYGSLTFEILSGEENGLKEDNDRSLVGMLSDGQIRVLYTGDIGEKAESALVEGGLLKKLTVLKVPHHGSKFSSSKSFLEALRPDLAIVSVGEKNSYGHPNGEVLMRLEGVGAKILRTDKDGEIDLECGVSSCELSSNLGK